MTANIANADRFVHYTPNNSTGPFPVPFPVFDPTGADLEVTLNGQVVTSGWSFTGTLEPGFYGAPNTWVNGSISFDAPISGSLYIEGNRAPRRPAEAQFAEGRGIPARDHNTEFNTLTAICRELFQRLRRTIRVPLGEQGLELPPIADRIGKYVGWDGNGNFIPLQPNEIHSGDIGDNAVISSKIADGAVISSKIADGAVTDPKVFDPPSPSHPDAVRASKLSFLQAGTDAVYRTVQDKLRERIHVADFGATPTVSSDQSGAIMAAIAEAQSRGGADIYFDSGTYRIDSTIEITESNIRLIGAGGDIHHDGGVPDNYTALAYYGPAASVPMVKIYTPANVANSKRFGSGLVNMVLECRALAGTGLEVRSIHSGRFVNVYVSAPTQQAYLITNYVAGTLAEATDTQKCRFENCTFRLFESPPGAHGFVLTSDAPGTAGANTSFNEFHYCGGQVSDGDGFRLVDADNNMFFSPGCIVVAGGTGLRIIGAGASDGNHFFHPSFGGVGGIKIQGTASGYAFNLTRNSFYMADHMNGTVYPTIDSGCRCYFVTDLGVHEVARFRKALFSRDITHATSGDIPSYATAILREPASAPNPILVYEDNGTGVGYSAQQGQTRIIGSEGGYSLKVGVSFASGPISSGNVAHGVSSTGAHTFPMIGTTAAAANAYLDPGSSNNLLRSTSSIRYKDNVADFDVSEAYRIVRSLRPVTYTSKAEADDPTKVFYGVIAEEVDRVAPPLVNYLDGKPDGIQYDRIVIPLLAVIGDLCDRLAALESKGG